MRNLFVVLTLLMVLPAGAGTQTLERSEFSLDRFPDAKLVYLDFWASWCAPCRKSFPWLNAMQEKYHDQGLVIVGVNLDTDREQAERFLEKWPAEFLLVMDPKGELAEQWKLQGMPSAVLLGADGKVRHRHIGFREDRQEEYEQLLQALLGEE